MSKVTGKTTKKPKGPYWYWTTLGPKNVNLADRPAQLPAGNYELFWDFRGNPGDAFEFHLTDSSGKKIADVADKVAPGQVDGWGQKPFVVT